MRNTSLALIISALAIMGIGAGLLLRLSSNIELGQPGLRVNVLDDAGKLELVLPERVLDFVSEDMEITEVELRVLPQDTTFARRLYTAADGFQIMFSVVLMGTDRTSIHKPEYCLTSQAWQIVGQSTIPVPIRHPHLYELPVREFLASRLVQAPDGSAARVGGVYLFWFVADGRLVAGHRERMTTTTWDLLRTGRMPRWAYVSCFATCPPGREAEASKRVQEFIAGAVPAFQTTLLPPAEPRS